MILVKSLQLIVTHSAGHGRYMVDVGLGRHGGHGGVNVPGLELIAAVRLPQRYKIGIGHASSLLGR